MTYAYETRVQDATFFTLDKPGTQHGFRGQVWRSGGESGDKVVWASNIYRDKRAARLQANRTARELRDYLARNGRCWKDDQDAARAAKKAYGAERQRLVAAATESFRAGMDAALREGGARTNAIADNPHAEDTPAWHAWRAGFLAAKESMRRGALVLPMAEAA